MLVVSRFDVPEGEADGFLAQAGEALAVLAARPGCLGGELGRSADDPTVWVVTTRWDSVGAYRRALGAYEVKLQATPVLSRARWEPSAFEVLARAEGSTAPQFRPSERARDAATSGPGQAP